MKQLLMYILLALLIPFSGWSETAFRIFTAQNGRTIEAAIRAYRDTNGKIEIERKNGKRMWVAPSAFSEDDQDYIRQWIQADEFMSSMRFRIEVSQEKDATNFVDPETKQKEQTINYVIYTVELKNNTEHPLSNLRLDLRVFLTTNYPKSDKETRVDGDQIVAISLSARQSLECTFERIALNRIVLHESADSVSYSRVTSDQKIKGVWIKVYGPEIDGLQVVREWYSDSTVPNEFVWQDIDPHSTPETPTDPVHSCLVELREAARYTKSNPQKAIDIFERAYERYGNPVAATQIGICYIEHLQPGNIPLGLEWLEKAAEKNGVRACIYLAEMYSTYRGHSEYLDVKKAIMYGKRSLSFGPVAYEPHRAMALAYAHDDQFDKAVEHQRKAIVILTKKTPLMGQAKQETISQMEGQLERYRKRMIN